MKSEAKVLIVILNYNTPELTLKLVDSLKRLNYKPYDVMVIDNCSPDDSTKILAKYSRKKGYIFYANKQNTGYAAGNNIGIRYGISHQYKYTWILNSDVLIKDYDILNILVDRAEGNPNIGVVGPLIISRDGVKIGPYISRPTFWRATLGIFFDKRNRVKNTLIAQPVYRVYGCCMLLRNLAMEKCDCMDERTFLYFEEDILAERLLKFGYYAFYDPSTFIIHNESSSMRTLTIEQIRKKNKIISKSRKLYYKEYLGYRDYKILLIAWMRELISYWQRI